MELFAVSLLAIGLILGLRLMAGAWDRERIRRYLGERGGRALRIDWAPFGRGWLGEKSDRIYAVEFVDADGRRHQATCKTSLNTGVYWSDDTVVDGGAVPTILRPPPGQWRPAAATGDDGDDNAPIDYWADEKAAEVPADFHGGPTVVEMPKETPEQELRRLRLENARLRQELERSHRGDDGDRTTGDTDPPHV